MRVFLFCTEKGIRIPLGRRDDCLKIHLVYDSHFEPLEQTLKEIGHTVIWDYSIEQFAIFAESGHTDADVAIIDGTAGGLKIQELYELLKQIRTSLFELRIIVQFPLSITNNKDLINRLIGLNIYDIRFADEFTIDDVESWLNKRMTLAELKYDGQQLEGQISQNVEYASQQDEEEEEEKPKRFKIPKMSMPRINLPKREKQPKEEKNIEEVAEEVAIKAEDVKKTSPNTFREIIVLYSPAPTGKTFVGVNLAVAVARTGIPTIFMDSTEYCGVKYHFNAPSFPFKLDDIPLTVTPYDKSIFQENAVFVVEANSLSKIPKGSKVILVLDSDYSHQLIATKNLHKVESQGIFWNQKDPICDPTKVISLPLIGTIPYFGDTSYRIKVGVPRALEDDQLCEVLLSIKEFDPVENILIRA